MNETKTHYRKVFKSDHLGVADLEEMLEEGKTLIFTIKNVISHYLDVSVKGSGVVVAGRRIGANIAYFKENIKPLVLNATNSKVVKSFNKINGTNKHSPFVEDWANTTVELFIDANVKMKGEVVGGVRIRQIQPKLNVTKPVFTESKIQATKAKGVTVKQIKEIYTITPEIEMKYKNYVAENG